MKHMRIVAAACVLLFLSLSASAQYSQTIYMYQGSHDGHMFGPYSGNTRVKLYLYGGSYLGKGAYALETIPAPSETMVHTRIYNDSWNIIDDGSGFGECSRIVSYFPDTYNTFYVEDCTAGGGDYMIVARRLDDGTGIHQADGNMSGTNYSYIGTMSTGEKGRIYRQDGQRHRFDVYIGSPDPEYGTYIVESIPTSPANLFPISNQAATRLDTYGDCYCEPGIGNFPDCIINGDISPYNRHSRGLVAIHPPINTAMIGYVYLLMMKDPTQDNYILVRKLNNNTPSPY